VRGQDNEKNDGARGVDRGADAQPNACPVRPGQIDASQREADHHQHRDRRIVSLAKALPDRTQGELDGLPLRKIELRHSERTAATLENGRQLIVAQLAPESGFLVFDLRADVFLELGNNVLFLCLGKPEPNGMKVSVEKFHVMSH
jgi:hypothetical protein